MGDFVIYACPACHTVIGGWGFYDPPVRCGTCGEVLIKDGTSHWSSATVA